jgi:hypothetical protein
MFRNKTKLNKISSRILFLIAGTFALLSLYLAAPAMAITTPGNGGDSGNGSSPSPSSSSNTGNGGCTAPNSTGSTGICLPTSCATDQGQCSTSQCAVGSSDSSSALCNPIIQHYVNPFLLFLGAGVGIVITIMLVIGGIEYAASGGNPNTVADAKKRIANALIALVTFGLMWAFLNWIIPNGVFS